MIPRLVCKFHNTKSILVPAICIFRNVFHTFEKNTMAAIRAIQLNHMRLYKICESLNTAYSIQIVAVMLEVLISLSSAVFFFVHNYLNDDWGLVEQPHIFPHYLGGALVLHTVHLFGFALCSSSTAYEACLNIKKFKFLNVFCYF